MDNETDEAGAKVSIMTLHAAKGLEFPAVFLPGWEDGLFPSQRSMDEQGVKGVEEERRLAYVGITRARTLCTISFAANRLVYGQWQSALPSRFIDELPADHVEVQTPPGLYGGGYGAVGMAAQSAAVSGVESRAVAADVYNSPGWRRLQDRAQDRPLGQSPGQSRGPSRATQGRAGGGMIDVTPNPFGEGERVFHTKFGYGTVRAVDADKLDVSFDKAGDKKLVARFVVPADQADDITF